MPYRPHGGGWYTSHKKPNEARNTILGMMALPVVFALIYTGLILPLIVIVGGLLWWGSKSKEK